MTKGDFDLQDFLPYLLNQAADTSSRGFAAYYKTKYGMLRTEWRVLFHLGRYGEMTAREICVHARIHKTKVSRAVQALETKRFLRRQPVANDRRQEMLALTIDGDRVFEDLNSEAARFDAELVAAFTAEERALLKRMLLTISEL